MLKAFMLIITMPILCSTSHAGVLTEVVSPKDAFHRNLHDVDEYYIVRYLAIQKGTWSQGWEKITVTVEVVEPLKGSLKKGDVFKFERKMDGKFGSVNQRIRKSFFVPRYQDNGKMLVDAQDPNWIHEYDKQYHQLALEHYKNSNKKK